MTDKHNGIGEPDDIEPSLDYDRSDDYLDANPSRGETAEDVALWELEKAKAREWAEKHLPQINMRVRQAG